MTFPLFLLAIVYISYKLSYRIRTQGTSTTEGRVEMWWNQVVISLGGALHKRLSEGHTDNNNNQSMNECTMISILIFPSALFLYISTFLLSPCPFYYGQPFGISRSSLHTISKGGDDAYYRLLDGRSFVLLKVGLAS